MGQASLVAVAGRGCVWVGGAGQCSLAGGDAGRGLIANWRPDAPGRPDTSAAVRFEVQ